MSEERLTDLTFLNSFTGGKEDKKKKYIGMFLDQAPKMLNGIKGYHESKDWHDLKVLAHSLKPQLKYMGVSSLEEVIVKIEKNAGEEVNLQELPALIARLEADCEKVLGELQEEIK